MERGEPVMMRYGDEAMGFSIAVEATELRVLGWGFWSAETCGRFADAARWEIGGSVRFAALKVDVRELKPMREEGQRVWQEALAMATSRGVSTAIFNEPPPLTKLQFIRLCRSAGITVQFV
jgi:hypothetical protein